ncbi:MAG TPA: hypothetical protein VJV03_02425 [Pyrinomonadaceae bacterium]|nr:hypothetical protein [Pyrinomonadaceae bacterium]
MKQKALVAVSTRRLHLLGLMTLLLCVNAPAVPSASVVARRPDLREGRASDPRTALAPQRRDDRRVRVFLLDGFGSSSQSPTSRLAVEVYRDGKTLLLSPGDELREGDRIRAQQQTSQEFFRGASVVIYNAEGEPAFIVGYHQGVDFTLSKLRYDPRLAHTIKVEITNHSTSLLGIERNEDQRLARREDSVDIYKEDGTPSRPWTGAQRDAFELQTDLNTTARSDARWIRAERVLKEGREGAKKEYVDVVREFEREKASAGSSDCGLGVRWNESESGWNGDWKRRGDTNTFDATWTKGGERVTAVLTVTINGSSVTVERPNASDNNSCTYKGTIAADGKTITNGTYTCTQFPNQKFTWAATISCH